MKLLVTKAITKDGVYYAKGMVAELDDARGGSYHRLFGWPYTDEGGEVSAAPVYTQEMAPGPVLADLTKRELRAYAAENNVELPAKATKTEILEIFEAR